LVAVASAAWMILRFPGRYQWDFMVYHAAGQRFAAGVDPYGPIAGLPQYLHYIYPPITAAVFAPLAGLGDTAAKILWFALKLAAFAGMFAMWKRATGVRRTPVPSSFFFVVAMGSALLVDFTAGNIATFEQFVLWIGFAGLLHRRYWLFAICTVLAAQFKLTPVFFLGLLLVIDEKPRWGWFAGSTAMFAAVTGTNLLIFPRLSREFLVGVSSIHERGWSDPAMLGAAQDTVETLQQLGLTVPEAVAYLLYGAAAIAVFVYTIRWWLARRGTEVDRVVIVLVSLATYALVMPRMKDYSFVALLPVAWYVLARPRVELLSLAAIAVLIPRTLPQLGLPVPLLTIPYTYEPLIAAGVLWWMLLHDAAGAEVEEGAAEGEAVGELVAV
jgi:hypothetical protein